MSTSGIFGGVSVAAGTISAFAGSVAPGGWVVCNGAALSRSAYGALFNAIGVTYGAGDGSTTFNVPDLRGEFLRGLDQGRGVDAGRALGSAQADSVGPHTHAIPKAGGVGGSNVDGVITDLDNGSTVTATNSGTETRPRNIAVLYCIKY